MTAPFVVGIADQRRTPGRERPVSLGGVLAGLALSDARVPEGAAVTAELVLELLVDGRLTAAGTISAPWEGACRRCLQPVSGQLEIEVGEVFEPEPADDADTYPLGADRVDLEPMIRDAVLLALPLAPLCRDDCPGPDPDDHPVATGEQESGGADAGPHAPDPRWSALADLEFD